MRALVFGGAGFLGSYVADELTQRGHQVSIFDKSPSKYINNDQKMIVGDILNKEEVEKAVPGHDIVYNFAGLADLNASMGRPLETIELNVVGNINILEASKKAEVKRFIYASTVYVFSKKGSFYGVSKHCSEKIVEEFNQQSGLPYTIIRYGSVYGKRSDHQNRIYRILREALESKKITFKGDGEEEREYIHAKDAAKLSVDIVEDDCYQGESVILTGVERFKYSQLLKMINEMLGNEIEVEFLNEDYKGHYTLTPYSFAPTYGKKIICNPFMDFAQGMLETMSEIHSDLNKDNK